MNAEQKIKYLPAGGIAGFVMSEEDIEKLEAEELTEQYGTTGIAQFSTIGKNMANFGRHGDDTVAHVETGELIVPRALIENNPKLKESIFNHLRELGVEDPERYVVGESKNSLNPTTGLPEFFFKKLFRSVSKVVKSVGKVLKKAAPIIVPIALNFIAPGLGAIWSGAIGSGITTLVQGGSIRDAFKSALIGGATGALAAGFSGPGKGLSGFGDNIAADVSMGTRNISNAFSQGSFAPLQSSTVPSIGDAFNSDGTEKIIKTDVGNTSTLYDGTKTTDLYPGSENLSAKIPYKIPTVEVDPYGARGINPNGAPPLITDAGITPDLYSSKLSGADLKDFGFQPDYFYGSGNLELNQIQDGVPSFMDQFRAGSSTYGVPTEAANSTGTSMYNSVKDFVLPPDASLEALQTQTSKILAGDTTGKMTYNQAFNIAKDNLNPNFLQKFGPSLALATAAGAAGGFFDAPKEEDLSEEERRTGYDVYNENPDLYRVGDMDLRYIESDPRVASKYPYYRPRNVQAAAQGGQIFPRRVGGIMPNEGIPNKDSVRAMLMPGEFVMTTDAVKGLGGGNMNKGINNMYGVMRNLEQRGRQA